MVIEDNRTEAQKLTHIWGVVGTDSFLSKWGDATNGSSYAVWACENDMVKLEALEHKISQREDMKRVRIVYLPHYQPKATHTHIYVA